MDTVTIFSCVTLCGFFFVHFLAQRQLQPGRGRRRISQTERHQRRVAGVAQGEERPDQFAPGT